MTTKNKLPEETTDQENREELIPEENKAQETRRKSRDEDWWNSVCYPDPHVSEK